MRKFVGFLLMNASETWPVHRAKSTKQWHKKNRVHLQGWPGNSPDMNLIESHAESRTSNIDRWSETNRFEGLKEHHSVRSEILLWVNAMSHAGCGSCRRWTHQVLKNFCLYFTILTNRLTYLQKCRYTYFPDSSLVTKGTIFSFRKSWFL